MSIRFPGRKGEKAASQPERECHLVFSSLAFEKAIIRQAALGSSTLTSSRFLAPQKRSLRPCMSKEAPACAPSLAYLASTLATSMGEPHRGFRANAISPVRFHRFRDIMGILGRGVSVADLLDLRDLKDQGARSSILGFGRGILVVVRRHRPFCGHVCAFVCTNSGVVRIATSLVLPDC